MTSLQLKTADKLLEWASIFALLSLGIYFAYGMLYFPQTIPVHFDATGHADRMGDKSSLWLLMIIPCVLWLALKYLQRHPDRLNYAVVINDQNRQRQYLLAHRLLAGYKLCIPCLSLILLRNVHGITMQVWHPGETWFAILMLALVILPLLIYLLLSYREPKS